MAVKTRIPVGVKDDLENKKPQRKRQFPPRTKDISVAFASVRPDSKFTIYGPAYGKKLFKKVGNAYAREIKTGDWVVMLSCEGVEVVR